MSKASDAIGTAAAHQSAKSAVEEAKIQRERWQKYMKKNRSKKKRLSYNPKEISTLLLRASRAQSASSILTLAKGKLGALKRCAASGQYDRREITNAIAHAERMVRCAQLKVNHLKEEEGERSRKQKESNTDKIQRKAKVRAKVRLKEKRIEQRKSFEQLKKLQRQKQEYENMERKRRMHRNEEHGKIAEADLKYQRGQSAGSNNAVPLSPLNPAVILELNKEKMYIDEKQLEQQAERETGGSQDKSTASDTAGTAISTETVSMDMEAVDVSAVAGSVDISI